MPSCSPYEPSLSLCRTTLLTIKFQVRTYPFATSFCLLTRSTSDLRLALYRGLALLMLRLVVLLLLPLNLTFDLNLYYPF